MSSFSDYLETVSKESIMTPTNFHPESRHHCQCGARHAEAGARYPGDHRLPQRRQYVHRLAVLHQRRRHQRRHHLGLADADRYAGRARQLHQPHSGLPDKTDGRAATVARQDAGQHGQDQHPASPSDALVNVPSGASGALVDAGWLGAGKVKAAISRPASRLEQVFATGTGTSASPGSLVVNTQVDELTIRRLAWADDGTWLLS